MVFDVTLQAAKGSAAPPPPGRVTSAGAPAAPRGSWSLVTCEGSARRSPCQHCPLFNSATRVCLQARTAGLLGCPRLDSSFEPLKKNLDRSRLVFRQGCLR